ncbi:MAG: HAD-IA family hydrolase [Piscinibacter sp.]|nr:HAD-IA family hydrolase [Piscinibacter sp.]
MSIEALIFDVDGTMADTEEAHRMAFNNAFERFRLDWKWSRDAYRALLLTTGGKERIAAHIAATAGSSAERRRLTEMIPAIHAEKTKFYSSFVADGAIPLRPGVRRLAQEALAAGCRLAIASTTTAANIDALLRSEFGEQGLSMFGVIACGDQVRAKKPAPDIYRLALAHLGVPPDRAVALEDSHNGLRAACGAGLWTIVTPTFWTEDHDFDGAALQLPHLGDPAEPLDGEPGRALQDAPWLTFAELARRADQRPRSGIDALYGLHAGAAG